VYINFNKYLIMYFFILSFFLSNTVILKSEEKFVPKVYYHFFNHPPKEDYNKSDLRIFLQVPHSDLSFIKNENSFTSTYEVNVIVWEDKNFVFDKSFENSFSVVAYEETVSDSLFSLCEYSLELEPKKYEIEILFKDKNSGNTSKGKLPVELKRFNNNTVNISDVIFLNRIEFLPNNVVKLIPAPINNISMNEKSFYAYFEMYVPSIDEELTIKYNVFDQLSDNEKIVKVGSISTTNKKKSDFFYTNLSELNLDMGRYLIAYQIEQDGNNSKVSIPFTVGWEGLPEAINDFDEAVDQMKYIASKQDIKKIKDKKGFEKFKAFKEFWDKKDPSPGINGNEKMIEYYRRIRYALRTFTSSRISKGWLTDRGYIFVLMGEPDEFYRQTFESSAVPPYNRPYEIWYYYEKRRNYVFIDETGFGDFTLISPIYYEDSDMLK